jgi:RNA polymerase sigma-70 factor (ECF subfamily)
VAPRSGVAYKRTVADANEDAGELVSGGLRLERALLAHHARFVAFLERRVGSRADAEEVLQAAYVRALEKGVPDDGGDELVAWFYRVLRNALVDRARRRDVELRSADRLARELEHVQEPELRETVCACMHDLLPAMKAEYAEMVRSVDLEGRALAEVAAASAITVNNATVRLHRARQALKKQLLRACGACAAHGCLDCHCRTATGSKGSARV